MEAILCIPIFQMGPTEPRKSYLHPLAARQGPGAP